MKSVATSLAMRAASAGSCGFDADRDDAAVGNQRHRDMRQERIDQAGRPRRVVGRRRDQRRVLRRLPQLERLHHLAGEGAAADHLGLRQRVDHAAGFGSIRRQPDALRIFADQHPRRRLEHRRGRQRDRGHRDRQQHEAGQRPPPVADERAQVLPDAGGHRRGVARIRAGLGVTLAIVGHQNHRVPTTIVSPGCTLSPSDALISIRLPSTMRRIFKRLSEPISLTPLAFEMARSSVMSRS